MLRSKIRDITRSTSQRTNEGREFATKASQKTSVLETKNNFHLIRRNILFSLVCEHNQ